MLNSTKVTPPFAVVRPAREKCRVKEAEIMAVAQVSLPNRGTEVGSRAAPAGELGSVTVKERAFPEGMKVAVPVKENTCRKKFSAVKQKDRGRSAASVQRITNTDARLEPRDESQ